MSVDNASALPPAIAVSGLRRVYEVKPKPVIALDGVDLEVAPGRVLRAARAERRRQDDADQDPHDPAPADLRRGPDLRVRRRRGDRPDPPDHEHGRGRGAVGLRDPDRPRAALDVHPVLRARGPRGLAPRRRAHRGRRHGRPAAPARQHPVDRPAPEDEHGPRPAQRPVDPVPGRADARPRRRGRPGHPRPRRSRGRRRSPGARCCSRPTTCRRPTSSASGSRSSTTAGSSPSARPTSSRSASRASRSSAWRSTSSTGAPRPSPGCRASSPRRSRPTRTRSSSASPSTWCSRRTAALGAVVTALAGLGSQILALRKSEPTLEDVFVELVGRGFTEEAEPAQRVGAEA